MMSYEKLSLPPRKGRTWNFFFFALTYTLSEISKSFQRYPRTHKSVLFFFSVKELKHFLELFMF